MNKEQEFIQTVAENLIYYRKLNHLTQLQLAEKLNYSDKSISKWERGESLPDLIVLQSIVELFGISLNDIVSERKVKVTSAKKRPKILITLLSLGICWLVATTVYVTMLIFFPDVSKSWLAFIYALPASMIILVVFSSIWKSTIVSFVSSSMLVWLIPLSLALSFPSFSRLWLSFISAIPVQIILILWFFLRSDLKSHKSIQE